MDEKTVSDKICKLQINQCNYALCDVESMTVMLKIWCQNSQWLWIGNNDQTLLGSLFIGASCVYDTER